MTIVCCSNANHPADWFCTNVVTLTPCGTPPSSKDLRPPWLIAFVEALNDAPEGPTTDQIFVLANALNSEKFYEEALLTGQYLAKNVAPDDFSKLAKVYQVQADAFEQLGNKEAAVAAMNLVANLATSVRLQNDLNTTVNW